MYDDAATLAALERAINAPGPIPSAIGPLTAYVEGRVGSIYATNDRRDGVYLTPGFDGGDGAPWTVIDGEDTITGQFADDLGPDLFTGDPAHDAPVWRVAVAALVSAHANEYPSPRRAARAPLTPVPMNYDPQAVAAILAAHGLIPTAAGGLTAAYDKNAGDGGVVVGAVYEGADTTVYIYPDRDGRPMWQVADETANKIHEGTAAGYFTGDATKDAALWRRVAEALCCAYARSFAPPPLTARQRLTRADAEAVGAFERAAEAFATAASDLNRVWEGLPVGLQHAPQLSRAYPFAESFDELVPEIGEWVRDLSPLVR